MLNGLEVSRAAHLALVNQAIVKQFLDGENPIGQGVSSSRLKVERPALLVTQAPDDWLEVSGVVGGALNDGLDRPTKPAVFLPYSFVLPPDESLFVRSAGNPEAALLAVKQRLRPLNPDFVVGQDHTLLWVLETRGWAQRRFISTLFSFVADLPPSPASTRLHSLLASAVAPPP